MKYATDGIINMGNETMIELQGFLTDDNEVILSDNDSLGDWKKVKVKLEPDMLKYWIKVKLKKYVIYQYLIKLTFSLEKKNIER